MPRIAITPAKLGIWERSWTEFQQGPDLAEGRRAFAAKEQPRFTWALPERD